MVLFFHSYDLRHVETVQRGNVVASKARETGLFSLPAKPGKRGNKAATKWRAKINTPAASFSLDSYYICSSMTGVETEPFPIVDSGAKEGTRPMRSIIGYTVTVHRGARAGTVKHYKPGQRTMARRFADRMDNDYGAICASCQPVFGADIPEPAARLGYARTIERTPAQAAAFMPWANAGAVAAEHAREVAAIEAAAYETAHHSATVRPNVARLAN